MKKVCTNCKQMKAIDSFRRHPGRLSHLRRSWCRRCEHDYSKIHRTGKWVRKALNLSRKSGGHITSTELRRLGEPTTCYLCGLPLTWEAAEIDHVKPRSKGGRTTIKNLRWAHRICNRVKHDLTLAEFRSLISTIIKHIGLKERTK